jgi:membrane fusion protein, multidrug efflux system
MNRTKRWLARAIAVLAVAAAIGLGVTTLFVADRRPRTNDGYMFAYSAGMATEVNGRILALYVVNNQHVKAGDPLLELDPAPFAMRLREAQAHVAAAKAQISLSGRHITSQKTGADAAATRIGQAREQLGLAQDTLRRLEPLLAKGYVTSQRPPESARWVP